MTENENNQSVSRAAASPVYVSYAIFVVCAVLAFVAIGPIRSVLSLHALGAGPTPYFIAERALVLNFFVPLSTVAISIFFLSPGLLIAGAFDTRRDGVRWLLKGFSISLGLITLSTILVQGLFGTVIQGGAFYLIVLALMLASIGFSAFRLAKGRHGDLNFGAQRVDFVFAAVTGFLVLALMSAKFYWENFSPDGGGVMYFTRLFINTSWPFWPADAGTIQKAPGLTSFLFVLPSTWFVRLIGENEFAVRAPHILYIGLLYVVLLGLIRVGREARLAIGDHFLIVAALLIYTLSVIYSGGYNPYFGDSPMPGARETMVVALFLGFVYFFVTRQNALMFLTGLLGYMSLPTGGLWLLLWFMAVVVIWRPLPKNRLLLTFGLMVVCALGGTFLPYLFHAIGLPYAFAGEFNAKSIINRLRYVAFWEPNRIAFWAVPLGIVPVLSLLLWNWQDRVSKTLTLISAAFFVFFYLQGYRVLLHHFIPAMFPPLIVMWRMDILQQVDKWLIGRATIAAGLVVAVFLAFPNKPGLYTVSREIGRQIEVRGEHFQGFRSDAVDTAHELLGNLFPIHYQNGDAEENFFGGPLVWFHYAREPKPDGQPINYVMQSLDQPAPVGARLHDSHNGHGLYVLDEALYQTHLKNGDTTQFGAPVFYTTREEIFGRGSRRGDRFVIDLVEIARNILGISRD
mgnify:CR=1 FL=1